MSIYHDRDWRRPAPVIAAEEQYGYTLTREPERDYQLIIGGTQKEQDEVVERMEQGTMCPACTEPFPAPPSLVSLPVFRAEYAIHAPIEWREIAFRRVQMGCCPSCCTPIVPESVDMQLKRAMEKGPESGEKPSSPKRRRIERARRT